MEQPLAGMGMVNYLLVKSRPRQKLPTQSRKAHLLETPPSPPPPRLQLMAAAEQCYDWYPSRSRPAAPPPGLSSSPQGSESDPWSWSWTWRSWPTRWPFTLSRGGSSPHLPGSPCQFPCGWGRGVKKPVLLFKTRTVA